MILKIFKAVWFLSLLVTLTVFMYIYASLPETLVIVEGKEGFTLSREAFFYLALVVISIFNAMVFLFSRLFSKNENGFLTWFFGLIMSLNLFFIILLYFLNLYTSDERFQYERLGFAIYGSLGLLIAWTLSWPVLVAARKILPPQSIS